MVINTHDISSVKNGFYDDYTHKRPYTKTALKQIAVDAGLIDIIVEHRPADIRGLGWLIRRGVGETTVLNLQRILSKQIKSTDIVLIARKPL